MSEKLTLYAVQSAIVKEDQPNSNFSSGSTEVLWPVSGLYQYPLLFSVEVPAAYLYRQILGIQAYVYINPLSGGAYVSFNALSKAFDEATVTYNTAPSVSSSDYSSTAFSSGYVSGALYGGTSALGRQSLERGLKNGVGVDPQAYCSAQTSRGSSKPYLVVTFGDADVTLDFTACSPEGGYVPKGQPVTFSWGTQKNGASVGDLAQVSAVLRYRENSAGAITEVPLTTEASYTLQAGISTDDFQWQIQVTDNNGGVSTSQWFTLDTREPASSATPLSPVAMLVDGTQAATFRWEHEISTGTAQTGYDLQVSTDNDSFSTIQSETTPNQYGVVPANTLPGGTVYWRVRTYNSEGTAGEWSSSAEIDVVSASPAPIVSVSDSSPRPEILWQSTGQQAFEARAGDWTSGPVFGTAKRIRVGTFLEDGSYTAEVRVQNQYGLWSSWGAAPMTVVNTPGPAITLTGSAGKSAVLGWTTDNSYTMYYIYRDGVLIGSAETGYYEDVYSIGPTSYQVRGVDAMGNYQLSNTLELDLSADTLMLLDVEAGTWMDLPLAETSERSTQSSMSQQTAFVHYSGAEYPAAEISPYRERSVSIACAFLDDAEAKRFEAMLGRIVLLKGPHLDAVYGVLTDMQKYSRTFFTAYTATVTQAGREEVVLYD